MLIRIAEPGKPAFQLRKGEEGISVFDLEGVTPTLTEAEVLESFRPGSAAVVLTIEHLEARGLDVVAVQGAEPLPPRLREAHREIRQGPGMSRPQFKQALKELE